MGQEESNAQYRILLNNLHTQVDGQLKCRRPGARRRDEDHVRQ